MRKKGLKKIKAKDKNCEELLEQNTVLREEKDVVVKKKDNFWIGLKKGNRNKPSSENSLTGTWESYLFAKGEQRQDQKKY